jgi:hypothetical protein
MDVHLSYLEDNCSAALVGHACLREEMIYKEERFCFITEIDYRSIASNYVAGDL